MLYKKFTLFFSAVCLLSVIFDAQSMKTPAERLEQSHRTITKTVSVVCHTKTPSERLEQTRRTLERTSSTTTEQQSALRFALIHDLSTYSPVLYTGNASVEKMTFNQAVSTIIISKLATHSGLITSTTELISELGDVAELFSYIHHLATTSASVQAMDGGIVKNTPLISIVPEVWNALKKGPLAGDVDYRRVLPEFIMAIGSLSTDTTTKKLTAEHADEPGAAAFLKYLNLGPSENGLYHPNDVGFFRTRKRQRAYYQDHRNIRWALRYILCALYYGSDMQSFSTATHDSGKGAVIQMPPIIRTQMIDQRSTTSTAQAEFTRVLTGKGSMIAETVTLRREITDTVERRRDIVFHTTSPLDFRFIQALAFLGQY